MNDINLKLILEDIEKLCIKAGQFILNNRNKFSISIHKRDLLDVATNVDIEAENLVIKHLSKFYPNHNIFSEEKGLINHQSSYTWVIDSLDGTKEFIRHIPAFSTNISLEKNNELLLGVIYNPNNQYLYSVAKNYGAFLNHQKINVSNVSQLSQSMVYTHLPDFDHKINFKFAWDQLGKIALNSYRLRGDGHDINSLCLVAAGCIDGYIFFGNTAHQKWWDVAAGILMAQEAGAVVTNIKGQPITNHDLSQGIIAANSKIHTQLLNLVNKN